MKPPAIDSAVQTTPPITIAPTMPLVPFMPTATKTTLATISVMSVIPDTGFEPTIAMALAATVVKRKEMMVTTRKATIACQKLCSTPTKKKTKVQTKATEIAIISSFILRSFSVRRMDFFSVSTDLPPSSFFASPTALLITPQERTIPIIPAIAMAPIPMLRP